MRFSKITPWTGCALVRAAVLVSSVLFGAATATAASTGCTSVNNGTFNAAFTPGRSPGCSGNTCTTSNVAGLTFVPGDTINYSLANDPAQADIQWTLVLGGDISAQAEVPPPNNLSGSIIIRTVQASGGTYASYTYSNSTQFSGTYTCTAGPPAPQTLSFTSTAPTNAAVGGPTYTPTATSTSGLTVALTIDAASSAVCSMSGGAVSFQTAGTCTIDANQAGDQNFAAAAQVQQSFTVTAAPTVTSIAPTSGPAAGGTSVTVTGTNFTGVTAVKFGSNNASSFTVNSATSITTTAPAGSGTVDVTVTTPGGTSATSGSDQFTYVAAPTVTSVAPGSGPAVGGTSVTITGTNFTGATAVKFGGTAASFMFVSATSITATSPARSAGIVDVTVTTAGGTSATGVADGFTYVAPTFTLSVGVSGSGTVTSTPSGISCGSTCSASFASGTQVTLNETPASGSIFSGWSGACSGAGSCVVIMSAAESVTATFTQALTRTFVSSSGVDTNPCTVAAPCATFAHAYTLTGASGSIAALDPGKYGPLTITYPVTVNGNGWAAITAPAQGNGITINAGSGNVILTGLEIDGAGAAYNGIVFNSGNSLTVSNCIVKDFISADGTSGNGIMIAPTSGTIDFTIVNTVALNNASAGIHYLPASGSAAATGAIDHVTVANNAIGMAVDLSGASGGSAAVTISNSVANNNTADGVVTASATGTVSVTVDRDEVSSNGTGVSVGANTSLLLSRSVIATNSAYGISNAGSAASSGDNRISGNGSSNVFGTALTSAAPQ
jgi:hypothetical protein